MRVHTNSGGDGEEARGGLAVEVLILNSTERDTPKLPINCYLSGGTGAERSCQVVGESIGGAERENGEGNGRPGQSLNDIMDRAIAPAGKDGVTSGRHSTPGVVGCFRTGAAHGKLGADAGRLDDANGMVQFRVALLSTSARVGSEQKD